MIDKETFMQIGKFTDKFKGLSISIDTCLKMLSEEKQVVMNPIISICVKKLNLIEKNENEENKIKQKWSKFYEKGK